MQSLLALDQLINTAIKINGDGWGFADESISARAFRAHLQGYISDRTYRAIDALFFWQQDHCFQSWRSEIERRQMPSHYR